jgi:hypothetical protein
VHIVQDFDVETIAIYWWTIIHGAAHYVIYAGDPAGGPASDHITVLSRSGCNPDARCGPELHYYVCCGLPSYATQSGAKYWDGFFISRDDGVWFFNYWASQYVHYSSSWLDYTGCYRTDSIWGRISPATTAEGVMK